MKLTESELTAWGRRIGGVVRPPVFIGLKGALGAGKSVLARAVARGAGVEGAMPSPTFNIVFRYPVSGRGGTAGRPPAPVAGSVIHADLFRIESEAELVGIGWDDLLADEGAIMLVEWSSRAGDEVPPDRLEIELGFVRDEAGRRTVDIERFGDPALLPGLPALVR